MCHDVCQVQNEHVRPSATVLAALDKCSAPRRKQEQEAKAAHFTARKKRKGATDQRRSSSAPPAPRAAERALELNVRTLL